MVTSGQHSPPAPIYLLVAIFRKPHFLRRLRCVILCSQRETNWTFTCRLFDSSARLQTNRALLYHIHPFMMRKLLLLLCLAVCLSVSACGSVKVSNCSFFLFFFFLSFFLLICFLLLLLLLLLLSLDADNHVDDYSGTLGGVRKVHISALVTSPKN